MGASASRRGYDEEEQASLLGNTAAALRARAESIGLAKPKPPPSRMEQCCPELSYSTRLTGFAFCFVFGILISLTSLNSFTSVLLGNPAPFAFKYTIGNVLSLCSYCFLVGPARQCAGMWAAERWIFTVCYLGSFAATLVCVFYLKNWLLTLVALSAQFVSMALYALSCLPAGMGLGMARRLIGC